MFSIGLDGAVLAVGVLWATGTLRKWRTSIKEAIEYRRLIRQELIKLRQAEMILEATRRMTNVTVTQVDNSLIKVLHVEKDDGIVKRS